MMISHHKERGKGNGLDRVSEYFLTYKCRRNHKFNLWLFQNLMMRYQMKIFRLSLPHHHQPDHHLQLERRNRSRRFERSRPTEYIHVHLRMLVNNKSLLYLLQEYTGIRQLRAKMKVQQPWVHRVVRVITQRHHKIKKTHRDRVHKHR